MQTDAQGEYHDSLRARWPDDVFGKKRKFNRKDENDTCINYLIEHCADDGEVREDEEEEDDDGEEEDDGDEDNVVDNLGEGEIEKQSSDTKGVEAGSEVGAVRRFMKGTPLEEDSLHYADQVDVVASFCEQKNPEDSDNPLALIDERSAGSFGKKGYWREYQGPLTAERMREVLSAKRFRSDGDGPGGSTSSEEKDYERREVFVTGPTRSVIDALATTAPRSNAFALRDLFYKHLEGIASMSVAVSDHGYTTYTMEFNIPHFVLKMERGVRPDRRTRPSGSPLRQSQTLSFLSSTFPDTSYHLYEAQTSVSVTGLDNWIWTAYGFVDTYFGAKESVDNYHRDKLSTGWPDPLAAGQTATNSLIWDPRLYYLRVWKVRMNRIRREWHTILVKVSGDIKRSRLGTSRLFSQSSRNAGSTQDMWDISIWSNQMVDLLRLFIDNLTDVVSAWEKFEREDISYFQDTLETSRTSTSKAPLLREIAKTFSKLRDFRRKFEELKKELCDNTPQGVKALLELGGHESTMFQQKSAQWIQILTVITIIFTPLALASNIFSTTGALPFAPTPRWFGCTLVILAITILLTTLVLYKWQSWQEYLMNALWMPVPHQKPEERDVSIWQNIQSRRLPWGRSRMEDPEMGDHT